MYYNILLGAFLLVILLRKDDVSFINVYESIVSKYNVVNVFLYVDHMKLCINYRYSWKYIYKHIVTNKHIYHDDRHSHRKSVLYLCANTNTPQWPLLT